MTSPATPEARMRIAKIIHTSLMTGVMLFLLATAWLHRVTPPGAVPVSGSLLTDVGLGILVAALLSLRFLPGPDHVTAPGPAPDLWWMNCRFWLNVRLVVEDG